MRCLISQFLIYKFAIWGVKSLVFMCLKFAQDKKKKDCFRFSA